MNYFEPLKAWYAYDDVDRYDVMNILLLASPDWTSSSHLLGRSIASIYAVRMSTANTVRYYRQQV